ncbi:reverse transcriptase domain-containing protein [Vairimorpha necatrix]|uniref:Reverse transcriptase domain-containing protein n=1 Tax=Vairimorpha necatrix TaxID=6039 RepID=A0AAX4JFI7_9MICR
MNLIPVQGVNLRAAFASTEIRNSVETKIKINDDDYRTALFVVEDLEGDIILGIDFMRKHNVQIDYGSQSVKIDNKTIT